MTPYYDEAGITIYHGDCREVLPELPATSVDLLLTDPPYGVSYDSGRGHMGCVQGDDGSVDIAALLRQALGRLRYNRHFYVFGPTDLSGLTVKPTVELIWDKGKFGAGNLGSPWGPAHERITFGVWSPYRSQATPAPLAARLRRGSVIHVPKQNNGRGAFTHPTEKPILLMRQLIESSSVIGDTVLDPFMGTGATLLAAQIETRRAIGIEIEERYCEIAAKRLAQGVFDLFPAEQP